MLGKHRTVFDVRTTFEVLHRTQAMTRGVVVVTVFLVNHFTNGAEVWLFATELIVNLLCVEFNVCAGNTDGGVNANE